MKIKPIEIVSSIVALSLFAGMIGSSNAQAAEGEVELPGNLVAEDRLTPLSADAVVPTRPNGRWYKTNSYRLKKYGEATTPGKQSLIQIKDPRAPQRYRYNVSLQKGATLALREGRVTMTDRFGRPIGTVEKPWAIDAGGLDIATRFEIVDRDTFVQVVEHRAANSTYPVLADPWFVVPVVIRVGAHVVGRIVVRRATIEAAKRWAKKLAAKQADIDIDKLAAKQPRKLLSLTKRNFRENVRRRMGVSHSWMEPYDAHHTLPLKHRRYFKKAGLNIHNPIFGHPWCMSAHRSKAGSFNDAWWDWLLLVYPKIRNSKKWRNRIERQRINIVSRNVYARTYQCRGRSYSREDPMDLDNLLARIVSRESA